MILGSVFHEFDVVLVEDRDMALFRDDEEGMQNTNVLLLFDSFDQLVVVGALQVPGLAE